MTATISERRVVMDLECDGCHMKDRVVKPTEAECYGVATRAGWRLTGSSPVMRCRCGACVRGTS